MGGCMKPWHAETLGGEFTTLHSPRHNKRFPDASPFASLTQLLDSQSAAAVG
jgi:hypothetical protein